jgi:hypothetical protein
LNLSQAQLAADVILIPRQTEGGPWNTLVVDDDSVMQTTIGQFPGCAGGVKPPSRRMTAEVL